MSTPIDHSEHLLAIKADRNVFIESHGEGSGVDYDSTLRLLADLYQARNEASVNFATYNLPQLPEQNRDEIYERIEFGERMLVAPNLLTTDYLQGTAIYDDELLHIPGEAVLITAEHATEHQRLQRTGSRKPKSADYGTGGLSIVVQEDSSAALIIPLGRQKGDANSDAEVGPLKSAMRTDIKSGLNAHISIHGMGRMLVANLLDQKNFGVMLGIGSNPTDVTINAVDRMKLIADKYDIRLGVNQEFISFHTNPPRPKRIVNGAIGRISFSAIGKGTSRAYSQMLAQETDHPFASVQMEFSSALRLMPSDYDLNPGKESQRTGVYIGYLFLKECIDQIGL